MNVFPGIAQAASQRYAAEGSARKVLKPVSFRALPEIDNPREP
jgi:hypothetical protein